MKRTKQIASILLASMMAMSTISMTALADGETAGTTTLSIGSASGDFSLADHTFKAYQILAGDVYEANGKTGLTNITWGSAVSAKTAALIEVLQKNASIFGENTEISDSLTAADFAQLVSGLSAENTLKLSVALENVVDANTGVEITGKDGGTLATGGYYLIKDTTADTVQNLTLMLVTSGEENTINVKQSAPTITNEIQDNDTKTYGAVGDYQIGDVATFCVTSTVPYTANYSDNYTYTINVKLDDGLEFVTGELSDDVAITMEGNDDEGYSITGVNNNSNSHIYITTDEAGEEPYWGYYLISYSEDDNEISVKVKLNDENDFYLYYQNVSAVAGQKLYLFYDAELTTAGAESAYYKTSTAWAEYTDITGASNVKTPESVAYDHTLYANVKKMKKGAADTDAALEGAAFALTKDSSLTVSSLGDIDSDGAPDVDHTTNLIPLIEDDGVYYVADAATIKDYEDSIQYYFPAGNAKIVGLDDNTDYYLIETKAPDNYKALDAPVLFNIGSASYSDDNITLITTGDNAYSITVDGTAGDDTITVENAEDVKVTLPSTGGMGTTIFYVLGSVLVLGSAVLLIVKKRMKYEN